MPQRKSSGAKKTPPAARKTAKRTGSTKPPTPKKVPAGRTSLRPPRTPSAAPRAGEATLRLPKRLLASLGPDPVAAIERLQRSGKAPADPDTITIVVDRSEKFYPFADSRLEDLRSWRGSEHELVAEAVKKSRRRPEELAKAGLLREAADVVKNDFRLKSVLSAGDDASRHGISGIRDSELLSAAKRYIKSEGRVTPSLLKSSTAVAFRTCVRFLERRAGELGLTTVDGKTYVPAARVEA